MKLGLVVAEFLRILGLWRWQCRNFHYDRFFRTLTNTPCPATLVLPLSGCGGSSATGGYGGATPEAAFGNLKTAFKNKDFKTAMGQTTPETQEMMIAGFSMIAPMMAIFDQEKGADKAKDFQKILDKHGVKPPDLAKMT